jgi:peptide/nickel transport system substrate-binding protein
VEVGLLGPTAVVRDGRPVPLGGARQRALFVLLALRRNQLVPVDAIIEELWSGEPPPTANKIVQVYVSQLRKALGDGVIDTGPGGYLLRLDDDDLDSARFEKAVARGRSQLEQGDGKTARGSLREALGLWRGLALSDVRYEDFARDEIGRLEELRLIGLKALIEAHLALDGADEAVAELEPLVHEHPLREGFLQLYMTALYRSGRQADALAAYQRYRGAISDELGLEPSAVLVELHTAILNHDPSVGGMRATQPSSPRPRSRRVPYVAAATALAVAAAAVITAVVVTDDDAAPSVDRDAVAFLDATTGRLTRFVPVEGAPTAVAVGAGGIWIAKVTAGSVAHVDPKSGRVIQTIAVGRSPGSIAIGGDSVWVANRDDNTVSRINPESDSVVQTIAVGAGPLAVAYGEGAVWVTNGEDRTLSRIDPHSGGVVATIRTNAVGRGVTTGGGSVWVTDESTKRLLEVDPRSNQVRSSATLGTGAAGIAFGAGAVWVANALDDTVSRIDAVTLRTVATVPVPAGPSAVTFSRGDAWVSSEFGSRVVRIDGRRNIVVGETAVGSRPEGLAANSKGLWIAVQAGGAGHNGGRLVVAGRDVGSLDPATSLFGGFVTRTVFDTLLTLRTIGAGSGPQLVPDLAAALPTPTSADTRYTFRLRPGIRYSDGTPLRAADFRRALERMLWIGEGPGASYDRLPGAAGCIEHRACDLSRSVVADGPLTLTVQLTAPDIQLFREIGSLVPVPAGTPSHSLSEEPIPGTGPYAVKTYVPGKVITLERNRYFRVWSPAARPAGYADQIVYDVVDDQDTAVRRLAAGGVDLVSVLAETPSLPDFARRHPRQVHRDPQNGTVFVFLNVEQRPFSDARVRRALNLAVDRREVVRLNGGDLVAAPTCQIVPPSATGYRPYCPYTLPGGPEGKWVAPDMVQARALIAASGTAGSKVSLWSFPDFDRESRYFVALLRRLGYDAHLHPVDSAAKYFPQLDAHPEIQAGFYGWFTDPLAVQMVATLRCGFKPNPAHFCDPRIDTELRRLGDTEPVDPAGAADLAHRLDREITDAAPWVPLFTPSVIDLTSDRVGNYQAQEGSPALDQLWVR